MLHKYCKSEMNHRLWLVLFTESKTHSHRTSQSPLKLASSKCFPSYQSSLSFRNSEAYTRRSGCRLGGLLAGSAGTAGKGRCQARRCFKGRGFEGTLPADEQGAARSQSRSPRAARRLFWGEAGTPPAAVSLRPAPLSTFPGRNSSSLRPARLPHRACAAPSSRRLRRSAARPGSVRCLAGAERSGDGAARPQGSGLRSDA